jgi:hypothetical protein
MKKSARKILSLVLTLVLICALAATAFAAASHSVEEETDSGLIITEHGSISTYSVSGEVSVDNGGRMNSLRVSIDYSYIQAGTTDTIIQESYSTTAYSNYVHSGSKTVYNTTCKKMVHATYMFRVEIPHEGAFNSTPFTLYN